jgi:pimeloyl-ACP methyl ester carboxylesterase
LNPASDPVGGRCELGYSSVNGFNQLPAKEHRTASLQAFAGHIVQIRFAFDTLDALYNKFEGWYVGNVAVVDSSQGTIFNDVLAGQKGWTVEGSDGTTPGWHLTDRRGVQFASRPWWYGNEATGTYQAVPPQSACVDRRNFGTLTSPPITVGSDSTLHFDTVWQIESVNPHSFDIMQVQLQDLGPAVARPLIFIPGIAGSELFASKDGPSQVVTSTGGSKSVNYKSGDKMWVDGLRVLNPFDGPEYLDVLRFDTAGAAAIDAFTNHPDAMVSRYDQVVPFFTHNRYVQGKTFYVLTYDWRFDASRGSNVAALDRLVQQALTDNPLASGVDIVTHSMGGMVARAWLLAGTQRSRASHVVMMGAPNLGTPKGAYAAIKGVCLPDDMFLGILNCSIPASVVQYIFRTLPGGLDQAVSRGYYSLVNLHDVTHPVPYADVTGSTPRTDYASLVQAEKDNGVTSAAIGLAEAFHASDLSWPGLAAGKIALVAGTKHCTMGQIVRKPAFQAGPVKLGTAWDFGEIDGDGTVVRFSASLNDGKIGSLPIYFRDATHGELTNSQNLQVALDLVRDLNVPKEAPGSPPFGGFLCKTISVHSPLEMQLTDSSGRRLGGPSPSVEYLEVPGGHWERFDDMKVATLEGKDQFKATFTGTAEGEATIRVRTINQGGVSDEAIFLHLPVTPRTRGSLDLNTGTGSVGDVKLDLNGDGATLLTFHPTLLTGAAAADTTPPDLRIDSPAEGQAVVGKFPVAWTATDAESGIATSVATLDAGGTPQILRVPQTVTVAPGQHTLDVFAEDRAGNATSRQRTFTADAFTWLPPLEPGFTGQAGRTIPVKFTVNTPAGAFVRDESVVLDLVDAQKGVVVAGPLRFGDTPASGVVIRDGIYHGNLRTEGVAPGAYILRVRFQSPQLIGEMDLPVSLK